MYLNFKKWWNTARLAKLQCNHNAIILINCRISRLWNSEESDVVDYILTRAPDTIILPWYASTLSLSIGMECTTSSNYNKGFPPLFYKQEAALIHCFSSFWRTLNPLGFPRLALSSHSCRDIMCTENYTICFLYILLFILLRFNLQGSFRMQMIIYIYPLASSLQGFYSIKDILLSGNYGILLH